MDLDAGLNYMGFVEDRHKVWRSRQSGDRQPWTTNPILRERKFTNVFRVLDPGSQFVLSTLYEPDLDEADLLLRLFLYRHTGRLEAWRILILTSGLPTRSNLSEVLSVWQSYRGEGKIKTQNRTDPNSGSTSHIAFERPMFTSAYLVFPQSHTPGTDKLVSIVDLTRRLFVDDASTQLSFAKATTQKDRFAALRRNKGVGDFMAMQILTDWGYFTEDREDEFIVPGPGAVKGAAALGMKALPACHWAHKALSGLSISVTMPDGRRRTPSLMDAQNTLCEFSKYVRFQGKPLTGQHYRPANPGPQPEPLLPVNW